MVDYWDQCSPQELPKSISTSAWTDQIAELKKWSEIDQKLKEAIEAVKKITKLGPSTQTYQFLDAAKMIHKGSNMRNKEVSLELLGAIAE